MLLSALGGVDLRVFRLIPNDRYGGGSGPSVIADIHPCDRQLPANSGHNKTWSVPVSQGSLQAITDVASTMAVKNYNSLSSSSNF